MKRTRYLALLLALVMVFALAAGCGDGGETQTPSGSSGGTDQGSPTPSGVAEPSDTGEAGKSGFYLPLVEETAELSYYFYLNAVPLAYMDADNVNFFRLAEDETNVRIDYTLYSELEEWAIMAASGDWCDMIDNIYNYSGGYGQALADSFVLELSELIETSMPNYNTLRSRNEEYYKDTMLDTGEVAAIWGLISDDRGAYPVEYGPIIRQDWLDALDLGAPETYDDWYNVLTAFKSEYGAYLWAPKTGVTLYGLIGAGYGVNGYTNSSAGTAPYYIEDGEVKFGATTDEFKAFLQMYSGWFDEGLIDPDYLNITNPFAPEMGEVGKGRWGIVYCIKDLIVNYKNFSEDPDFQMWPITDPVLEEGQINEVGYPTTLIQRQNTGISADASDPELCARWLDFWYSDEGMLIANYGEEGVSYEMVNGEPQYTDLMLNNPEGVAFNTLLYVYARNMGSYMNIWHKSLDMYDDATTAALEIWSGHNNSATYPQAATMTTEETMEHTQLATDLLVYVDEFVQGLIVGNRSFDEWDAFVAQVEGMNVARMLEIKQAAYDRYLNR